MLAAVAAGVLWLQPLHAYANELPSLMIANELPSIILPAETERAKTFQQASVDVADAAYPVVMGLKAKSVAPLASKVVALATTGDSQQIIRTIDAGLDAFLSVPPDRFLLTVRAFKSATAEATNAPSCNLICMPPVNSVEKVVGVASDALSVTNPEKLKSFLFQGGMSLASGEKGQYAGVLAETLKFSLSLDKGELSQLKERTFELVIALDNAQAAATPPKLPQTKSYAQNAAIEKLAVELADGLYPIVQGLEGKSVAPLASKVVVLAASGDPKEIIRTIDAGLDAFLSVPIDRFFVAARSLKTGTAEAVGASACNLVCVPSVTTVEMVAGKMANALSVTDPGKLKTFIYQAIRSLESGDKKQLAAVVAEGRKFEASLDQTSVRKATTAALGVLKAAGAPLSESEAAWVNNFVGL